MSSELTDLRIGDIVCRKPFQIRSKLDPGTVKRYAGILKQGGTLPPVTVARIKTPSVQPKGRPLKALQAIHEGTLVLVDGFHRVEAHLQIGADSVPAQIVDATKEDALWLGARANLTHGLPLKMKDLRGVFRRYIQTKQHRKPGGGLKSYREIAADLNGMRSHVTFRVWMRKDFLKLFQAMGRDDEGRATGGLPDASLVEPNEVLHAEHQAALDALRSAAGLLTPVQRWETIDALKATLAVFEELPRQAPDF